MAPIAFTNSAKLLWPEGLMIAVPLLYAELIYDHCDPMIAAPFSFGVLILRPNFIAKWTRWRAYLTVCVAMSALAWTIQFIWLLTR